MPPPLDMEFKTQVERDRRDMLKHCKEAAKRRAFPPWREPGKLEERKARAAEKRGDEEDPG
eukprot:4067066-Pyramimonas_sp.AAC.1